ncbi:hypothetical protein P171DRAFT_355544 [Karstenula rhodostoma CBS 690.94]|uniref:Uncharacterized protein n=1 Tax=Karstenula rhodostoma CBS 690.94 TaxID=1392251 RepID=A0A9P4PQW8_9PLEO|nr:hypothetical protein P171DRAFT_355544 [Karstenula rhodostoma CBS 690.94]
MGGHAFRGLSCPRMSPEVYLKIREQTTNILRSLFAHVVVPTEMPEKPDYGDVDFLVSGFLLEPPDSPLNWQRMVSTTRDALNTPHGRQGHLNPDVMYFAIPHPNGEHWIQIDVKVCATPDEETFAWMQFQLLYASGLKMLGSLVKPLGLTISPAGLHIRVEEMESTNFPGSLVFVTMEPGDVLKILGLDRRFLRAGFDTVEEICEYFTGTWVFNPAHYAARLEEGKYRDHLEDRSGPWVAFVTEWLPQRYPGYRLPDQDIPLHEWRKQVRIAVREKVFTMFPHITPEYYAKRAAHLKEVEEQRLQQLLTVSIPVGQDGWSDSIPEPTVVVQDAAPATPPRKPTIQAQWDTAQARVNYVGMWRRRFEKEDAKRERERVEKEKAENEKVEKDKEGVEKVEVEVEARRAKILERLAAINGC